MERRGPHKSMHCKFCKPPGTVTPEKPSSPILETKTKLHLSHQSADLKIFDVYDEPGVAAEEGEACICQVEGYVPCPKCVPDKNRSLKKTVCDCPLGSKPRTTTGESDKKNGTKKKKPQDDEFWWEKYDREHDAAAKEAWKAYLAQRKKEKKYFKCREKESTKSVSVMKPKWFQKLSCQQTIYLEYLSTAIRLDIDENIIDRTSCILTGIGLYPVPGRKILEKCLRYCKYNTLRFLQQLTLLEHENDPFKERVRIPNIPISKQDLYAWNDRIIMACICHLEFPNLLREIMDRIPPLPQEKIPPPIPIPKFQKIKNKVYESPYDEPLWKERLNWVEKEKIERINRAREHLNTKRVKIPSLALVRRPSLIDARPAFLANIVANRSCHRSKKPKRDKMPRKEKLTFDSKVDVTAIAGIEASDVSTTPKADSEDICAFLREQRSKSQSIPELEDEDLSGENEEEEYKGEGEVIEEETRAAESQSEPLAKLYSEANPLCQEELTNESSSNDDVPFVSPLKTQSGATIEEPCLPPKSSPGPPASHYDLAKRELGLINQDICPFGVSIPDDEFIGGDNQDINTEDQLKKVVQKLKELNIGELFEEDEEEEEEEEDEDEDEDEYEEEKKQVEHTTEPKRKKVKKEKDNMNPKTSRKKKTESSSRQKTKKSEKHKKPEISTSLEKYLDVADLSYNADNVQEENEEEALVNEEEQSNESQDSCICESEPLKKDEEKSKKKKKKKKKKNKSAKKTTKMIKAKEKKPTKKGNVLRKSQKNMKPSGKKAEQSQKASDLQLTEEEKVFVGDVGPLLKTILKDLSEEGFISAGYEDIEEHPDIKQLIKYLYGEVVTQKKRKYLDMVSRGYWRVFDKTEKKSAIPPELGISLKKYESATWNDKIWIMNLAKKKKEEFFFTVAKNFANYSKDFYLSLNQEYFGTEKFLNSYYAYLIPKKQECIMRGLP